MDQGHWIQTRNCLKGFEMRYTIRTLLLTTLVTAALVNAFKPELLGMLPNPYCKQKIEHAIPCASCGAPAHNLCGFTDQFICGAPLCDECEHVDNCHCKRRSTKHLILPLVTQALGSDVSKAWARLSDALFGTAALVSPIARLAPKAKCPALERLFIFNTPELKHP